MKGRNKNAAFGRAFALGQKYGWELLLCEDSTRPYRWTLVYSDPNVTNGYCPRILVICSRRIDDALARAAKGLQGG